jgi:toxin ParE1/3/4
MITIRPLAERDIFAALEYFRSEGGADLARKWVDAIQGTFEQIATHPYSGSKRYAEILQLDELRFRLVPSFPYLVFYCPEGEVVEVWRVLHGQSDIPVWLRLDT